MRDLNNPIYYLYETYSLLLSSKKREIFELSYFDDLSLSEIAELCHCTRQSISNMLSRTCRELNQYEAALGICKKQLEYEDKMKKISALADRLGDPECDIESTVMRIKALAKTADDQ